MDRFYALYVRVSSEDQATSKEGSLVSQEQRLKEYLSYYQKLEPYVVYKDEGTGKNTNRPKYQSLMDDIRNNRVIAVLCTELSRISRSVIDFYQFMNLCKEYNVDFISLKDKFDTTSAHGKLIVSFFISLAQFESEQISERTSANLQARARRGLFNGGILYGYRPKEGQKGYLEIDEMEANVVRMIFDKYIEMKSYVNVSHWINERGHRKRNGKRFSKEGVLYLLKNPAYISKRKLSGQLVEMQWPSIISQEKWDRVQELLKENYHKKIQLHEGHTFLLSGLLYCKHCGTMLENGSGIGSKGKKYFYYRHPNQKRKPTCTISTAYPAEKLEEFFYQEAISVFDSKEVMENACKEANERFKESLDKAKREEQNIKRNLDQAEKEAFGLIQSLQSLSPDQIREYISPRLSEISERKKALQERLCLIQSDIITLENKTVSQESMEDILQFLKEDFLKLEPEEKKRVLKALVHKIEILEDGRMVLYVRVFKETTKGLLEKVRVNLVWYPEQGLFRTFLRKIFNRFYCLF